MFQHRQFILPQSLQEKLKEIIVSFQKNEIRNLNSNKIRGRETLFKIKLKNYRLFFSYVDNGVVFTQILPRNERTYSSNVLDKIQNNRIYFEIEEVNDDEINNDRSYSSDTIEDDNKYTRSELIQWQIPEEYHKKILDLNNKDDILDLYSNNNSEIDKYIERIIEINEPTRLSTAREYAAYDDTDLCLSPEQQKLTDLDEHKPILVKGYPGTGKSLVAIYRAKKRVKEGKKVLLTSYSLPLIEYLGRLLRSILEESLLVRDFDQSGIHLRAVKEIVDYILSLDSKYISKKIANWNVRELVLESALMTIDDSIQEITCLGNKYLLEEFSLVIEGRGIESYDAYKNLRRYGRRHILNRRQKYSIWCLYEKWTDLLEKSGYVTEEKRIYVALKKIKSSKKNPGLGSIEFDEIIIDEAQDLSPVALELLCQLCKNYETGKGIYLTADVDQSIYQRSFSWNYIKLALKYDSVLEERLSKSFRNTRQLGLACPTIISGQEMQPTVSSRIGEQPEIFYTDDLLVQIDKIIDFLEYNSRYHKKPIYQSIIICPDSNYSRFIESQLNFKLEKNKNKNIRALYISPDKIGSLYQEQDKTIKILDIDHVKGLEESFVVVLGLKKDIFPNYTDIPEQEIGEVNLQQQKMFYVACSRAIISLLVIASKKEPSPFVEELCPNNHWKKT
ncbi:UvrD-helicase domain-containing protein [Synechococcus sp. BDU 130192]|uniref:UvrD-helicase domain-containing protein n=1 Tax=Synechococcus sp. BDU 130192 TaxID=2042059 RepID=UPI001C1F5F3F|nr:UvrD-helicase domain-containing protein [Synechococcus sp. BDU 130192]